MDQRETDKPKRLSHERRVKKIDSDGIFQVGGCADNALVSCETKHPALLPREHWISLLMRHHVHQCRHTAIATTVVKTQDLVKSVKFKCVFCREIQAKVESQVMADLPECHLAPLTLPFYYMSCDYFGPYNVKIGRNKTTKYYDVIITCLNTRTVHLELAVDYSIMEFIQVQYRSKILGPKCAHKMRLRVKHACVCVFDTCMRYPQKANSLVFMS